MILHGSRSGTNLARYWYHIPVHYVMFVNLSVLVLPLLSTPPVNPPIASCGCCYVWSCDQTRWFVFSLFLELCKAVHLPVLGRLHLFSYPSRIFSSSSDMPTIQTVVIFSYFWWLLTTFHISIKVSTTHAFIILFPFFILMCRAVIVFNIELNAPLAISILFDISSAHYPFDVIVCPK